MRWWRREQQPLGARRPFHLEIRRAHRNLGNSVLLSVTAYDASGNIVSDYAGTVRLSITDPKAIVDCCSDSFAGTGGGKGFEVTFFTTGTQNITVTDTSGPASGNSGPLTVRNPSAPGIDPTAPQGATLNKPYAFTFVATGYDAITFSASGTLPPGMNPVTSRGLLIGTPTATETYRHHGASRRWCRPEHDAGFLAPGVSRKVSCSRER